MTEKHEDNNSISPQMYRKSDLPEFCCVELAL